jgi:hypothetical protein
MDQPNPSETVSLISPRIKTSWQEISFPGRNYREAPHMSQGKRIPRTCGAVGQLAVMATRTLLSINDFIGTNLAVSFLVLSQDEQDAA